MKKYPAFEAKIRVNNQITVPVELMDLLKAHPGDFLRFEVHPRVVLVCKSVTRAVQSNHVLAIEGASD
jgi:bifunctional DNA-binding transcriptional regulator/antitoxin component of YhaV-PrlF toxin-antitoxin module